MVMVQLVLGVSHLHLIVLCWILGNPAVRGENEISLVTESEVMTVRNGSQLVLNCTILGPINATEVAADKLFWLYGRKQLTSNLNTHVINNTTKQLLFNSISWDNAGEYWCRLSALSYHIPAVSVCVIIGDIPGQPRILRWENVELHFKLYWLAPSYDGGLPLEYCFKYTEMDHENVHVYCRPSSDYSVEDGMYSSFFPLHHRFNRHKIWIEARNSVGSAESPPVVAFLSMEIESIRPCQINVTSLTGQVRAIEVQWKRVHPECSWSEYKKYYFNISYRAQGDLYTESTFIGKFPTVPLLLDQLKPYTQYYVFVSFQLNDSGYLTLPSSVIGPLTAWTNEEAPSEGPTNITCNAVVWPQDKGKMNVTLTWKPPPRNKWNGVIRSYKVLYKHQGTNRIVNLTSRQLVVSGLNASLSYHFLLRACTTDQDHCSSAKQCPVQNFSQDSRAVVGSQTSNWLVTQLTPAAAAVFAFAVSAVVVLAVNHFWRKKKRLSRTRSSSTSRQVGELQDLLQTLPAIVPSECPFSENRQEEQAEYCEIKDSDESSTDSVLISLD